jgi:hypothetical protein
LLGLIELYQPAHLVALCTPEGSKTIDEMREWFPVTEIPRPEITKIPLAFPEAGAGSVESVLATLAALDPPTKNVHLDVTFGPRHATVPALLAGLLNAAAGRWQINRLTYVNITNQEAPPSGSFLIEDLTAYLQLPALAAGVANLRGHGDLIGFVRAARPLLATLQGRQPWEQNLDRVAEHVDRLRIGALTGSDGINALNATIGGLRSQAEHTPLVRPFLLEAADTLDALRPPKDAKPASPRHFARLVAWYRDHGSPERALLLATEALTFLVCKELLRSDFPRRDQEGTPWAAATYFASNPNYTEAQRNLVGAASYLRQQMAPFRNEFAHANLGNAAPRQSSVTLAELLQRFIALCEDPAWPAG